MKICLFPRLQVRKNVTAPKPVYRLFRIAYHHQALALAGLGIHSIHNGILVGIGILEFIN